MSAGGPVAFAIILMGLVIGFAIAQPSMEGAMDELREAREEMADHMVGMKNVDFTLSSVSYNNTTSKLNLTIKNTGSETFVSSDLLLLVDGVYVEAEMKPSGILYPTCGLKATIYNQTQPEIIKVVGPWGIARSTDSLEEE